jgi:hypothetical protein
MKSVTEIPEVLVPFTQVVKNENLPKYELDSFIELIQLRLEKDITLSLVMERDAEGSIINYYALGINVGFDKKGDEMEIKADLYYYNLKDNRELGEYSNAINDEDNTNRINKWEAVLERVKTWNA